MKAFLNSDAAAYIAIFGMAACLGILLGYGV